MTRLVQIAAQLQGFLDSKSWPNCVIGGIAVQRWGEPRLTSLRALANGPAVAWRQRLLRSGDDR